MHIISAPINGGHDEVGGDWVLPQVLIAHVTKSSNHLILTPVIISVNIEGLDFFENQHDMVDCALGDVQSCTLPFLTNFLTTFLTDFSNQIF